MPPDAIDLNTIRRALVVKLRHHGDVLLTSPLFTVLKNHAPHIAVDALVYRDTREMLTLHPAIDTVFYVDRNWKKEGLWRRFARERELIGRLRRRKYDLLIHLTESPRGALLGRMLGTRYRVARAYPGRRGRLWCRSFTHLYPVPSRPRHHVEIHLDALRRIGLQPRKDERRLVLEPGADAQARVDELFSEHRLENKGFVHFHPTSRWLFKCWPEEQCTGFINQLQASGEKIVITAAPSRPEMERVRRMLAKVQQPPVNLAGSLTLKHLAALTARAKCFVGVDSVPAHIAAAMQTPAVVLFGPSGDLEWGPWQVSAKVLTSPYSCRPCGLDGCGGGKLSECLQDIGVDEVVQAVHQLIRER